MWPKYKVGLIILIFSVFIGILTRVLIIVFGGKMLGDIGYESLTAISNIIIILGVILFIWTQVVERTPSLKVGSFNIELKEELQQAINRSQESPDKVKPAWDLARVRLELYFDRNLSQINYIFWLSVVVMVVGFAFILFGISKTMDFPSVSETKMSDLSRTNPSSTTLSVSHPAFLSLIAGIITEFIGATFLFIYRSTIQQASNYTKTLERINSVGMAMQILDTISEQSKTLQDQTKADIVKMLLSQNQNLRNDTNEIKTEQSDSPKKEVKIPV